MSNDQLRRLLLQAGYLRDDGSVGLKVFARAVGQQAGRTFTHTYVRRWLDGMVPRDAKTRDAIVSALSQRLGRQVGVGEVGFGKAQKVQADLGLDYPDTLADSVKAVAHLWQADVDSMAAVIDAPANSAAWNEAALSWLVTTRDDVLSDTGKRKVGEADIRGIRRTTAMFDALDGEHGGGHARRALIEFLRTDLVGVLAGGTTNEQTKRELFKAATQATLLGAWMSYDAGLHGLAQRYFIQSLRISESAGDRLLGASILDAMSHQATFLGRYKEAANLARSAQMGTTLAGSPSATAHFAAMEARALSRMGDVAGCDRAMAAAVREFERRDPDNDPADWFSYFNEAELAAELGHCNRDLGRANDGVAYASQSLGPTSSGYVRSDFFATMVLADSHLDGGDVAQACDVALRAINIGESLKSARCGAYVEEFRTRLTKVGKSVESRDFVERVSTAKLWTSQDAKMVPNYADLRLS
ncbi:XRE family transcriptional regulator [Amycolatopsis sp. NBC_00348]|uniref:XRE family transcriptional regulator n=1 Tax=unclassified Amycolatopsis TaxID=2618356 RepID=UPI002E274C46|nr:MULTISPECIES: XRE family transcriptional regulator [unclassified Amycolatopsis]